VTQLGPFLRRHLGTLLGAVAGTIVVVGGVLILTLAGSGHTSSATPVTGTTPGATTTTTLDPQAAGSAADGAAAGPTTTVGGSASGARSAGAGARAASGARGRIVTIAAGSWTITTARGVTVSVVVTVETRFGTPAAPLTATDFAVGDDIGVVGRRAATTVTATRIVRVATTAAPATTAPAA